MSGFGPPRPLLPFANKTPEAAFPGGWLQVAAQARLGPPWAFWCWLPRVEPAV